METPLRVLIERNDVSPRVMALLQRDLLDMLAVNDNLTTLTTDDIIIAEDRQSLYIKQPEQEETGSKASQSALLKLYGEIIILAVNSAPNNDKRLAAFAKRCIDGEFKSIDDARLATEKRISNSIYIPILVLCALLILILAWLNNH